MPLEPETNLLSLQKTLLMLTASILKPKLTNLFPILSQLKSVFRIMPQSPPIRQASQKQFTETTNRLKLTISHSRITPITNTLDTLMP